VSEKEASASGFQTHRRDALGLIFGTMEHVFNMEMCALIHFSWKNMLWTLMRACAHASNTAGLSS